MSTPDGPHGPHGLVVVDKAGGLTSAVETGTYLGDSALALSTFFEDVWSVELVTSIY